MFRKNRDEHTRTEEAFFRLFLTRRQRAGSEPRRFYRKIWDHKLRAAALEQMRSIARSAHFGALQQDKTWREIW